MQAVFDFRMKKQTNVSKRQINLYKSLENVSRSLLEPIQISMMELLLQKQVTDESTKKRYQLQINIPMNRKILIKLNFQWSQ